MKKILITGINSYIGSAVENWILNQSESYSIETISMKNEGWKQKNLSKFDVIFHVAGIAHVSSEPALENLYYKVNRDLTIEIAKKAKVDGVKQFVFMSSIIVYGSNIDQGVINKDTIPSPDNFYGDSKLQAENGLISLESESFNVAIIRPPFIYGKGAKGNYSKLSRLARHSPIFPLIENKRSMLYIDNLCEFVKNIIDYNCRGVFFPQNKEYVNTSGLVSLIAISHKRKILLTTKLNWIFKLYSNNKVIKKVFGNLVYEKSMSNYGQMKYQVIDFEESVLLTEEVKFE